MSHHAQIQIEGMTCGHCTSRVHDMLGELPSVSHVEVNLDAHLALIELTSPLNTTHETTLTEAVEDAGFDVIAITSGAPTSTSQPIAEAPEPDITAPVPFPTPSEDMPQVILEVRGMTCASCVARVERALQGAPGVASAVVNYATERATVIPRPEEFHDDKDLTVTLKSAIESAGYTLASSHITRPGDAQGSPHQTSASHLTPESDRITTRLAHQADAWARRFGFGFVILPAIMLLQMGPMWFDIHLSGALKVGSLVAVGYLTAVTLAVTGRPFFEGAWRGLRHGSANMDTLVALGAGVAFGYSLVVTIMGALGVQEIAHVYYDGAAMIVTLISLGKWLEVRARGVASASMEALLELSASTASVWRGGGWQQVEVGRVEVGDRIALRPGEKVPVDARVLEGTSDVDESMLTGESVPVTRGPGDELMAATLNVDGYMEAEAIRVGAHTALAHIINEVERAQQSKADIQRLADRISAIFVPVILVIALATAMVWWFGIGASFAEAIEPAIAVLVVACPCALGLATPTALMVGSARGARHGVLIREANALEQASRLDALIFDKTGTLTTGEMRVTHVITCDDRVDEARVLALASALEHGSEHPIARAICAHSSEDERDVSDINLLHFKSIAGHGVEAHIDGVRTMLGKPSWVLDELHPDSQREAIDELRAQAKTVIVLATEQGVLGAIAVADSARPGAREVIEALRTQGIEVWMVTGDDDHVARAIAHEVGIFEAHIQSQVLPGQKAEFIRTLQAQDKIVGMVGDGINDAPALTQADLGIAMGSGADVAMEAADMTLVGHDIRHVLFATNLARATYHTIRQNLFWAFAYNAVLIPVAAAGLLVPAMAAGAMALSSVTVVSNSLRLRSKDVA